MASPWKLAMRSRVSSKKRSKEPWSPSSLLIHTLVWFMQFVPALQLVVIQNLGPQHAVGIGFCRREFVNRVMMQKTCHLTFVNARSASTTEDTGVGGYKCVTLRDLVVASKSKVFDMCQSLYSS